MAFAIADDVATRLGRELTAPEEAMVEMVLAQIEAMITEIDGRATGDISPVPAYYRALCIEKALAVGSNPNGLVAEGEELGSYSYNKRFRERGEGGGSDLFLTPSEERIVRRIANNRVSGSSQPDSLPHDAFVSEDVVG